MNDLDYMRMALEIARAGVAAGQSPFGAVIVRDSTILASNHNTVLCDHDPSAHAEVNAIRAACKKHLLIDLTGATIYSTTEPCPMCFTAIHWSKLSRIVYGAAIADAAAAGFQELLITNEKLKSLGRSPILLIPGVLKEDCVELLRSYQGPKY